VGGPATPADESPARCDAHCSRPASIRRPPVNVQPHRPGSLPRKAGAILKSDQQTVIFEFVSLKVDAPYTSAKCGEAYAVVCHDKWFWLKFGECRRAVLVRHVLRTRLPRRRVW